MRSGFQPVSGRKAGGGTVGVGKIGKLFMHCECWSDIPTYMQGREGFMLITNHFCPSDKLPLFIGGGGFLRVGAKMTILLDNSVRQITDKEMRKSAKRFASLLIRSEGGHLVGPVAIGRTFIGRKEFRKEHSDCFEVYDAFSSDLIKDGKVYLSDFSKNKAISGISLLKMHNDTDGVIDYCRGFFS